jgi:phage-related protein
MLRSTGAIAEDAEAFNRLTSAERVTRIRAALGRFTVAADAYGRSWAGITSSFKDIVQQLGAKALGPVFESLKKFIGGINERLLRNRSTLEANLEAIGTRVAAVLDRVFGRALDGLDYVLSHWDEIGDRIQHVVERVKALIPHLITAAKIYAGVSIARTMVGGGLQAASVATGAVSMVGQIGGLLGAGGGVAAAGGGAAAAGGAAGGGMAALQGVFASLSAAAGPLAIILIPIVGLITLIADKWEALSEAAAPFIEILSDVGGQFLELLSALWELLKPLLEILGALVIPIIAPFVAVLGLLLIVLKPILWLLTKLVEALAWVAEAVWTQVVEPIVDAFIWLFGEIGKWISNLMGSAEEFRDEYRGEVTEWVDISTAAQEEERRRLEGHATQGQRAPEGRATHVTDMRGSRITVKQEFRDADPDRVAIQMIQDIARQAEQQTTSGFVPAVTR